MIGWIKRFFMKNIDYSKVLILVPTEREVPPAIMASINSQIYKETELNKKCGLDPFTIETMIYRVKANKTISVVEDIYRMRKAARKEVLKKSDAGWIFWWDSDVWMESNAVEMFMIQAMRKKTIRFHIQGGYYVVGFQEGKQVFSGGTWATNKSIQSFLTIDQSLIRADKIDFGCCFMSREALEKVDFINPIKKKIENGTDKWSHPCECLLWSIEAAKKGFKMYMNGDVVCNHHKIFEEVV